MSRDHEHLERYVELANEYVVNSREGRLGDRCVDYFGRNPKVIMSAPHAVRHLSREGEPKAADAATGGLVRFVSERTEIVAVVASGGWVRANANHVLDGWCPYRQVLTEVATPGTVLVDLHGMADRHGAEVCVGTGADPAPSAEAVAFAVEHLRAAGLRVAIDNPFSASNPGTITSWAQRHNFRAFQIEVCSALRSPWQDQKTALRFAYVLCDLVDGLAAMTPSSHADDAVDAGNAVTADGL
jgi:hypothetical protein